MPTTQQTTLRFIGFQDGDISDIVAIALTPMVDFSLRSLN